MINLRNSPFLWFAVLLLLAFQPGTLTLIYVLKWPIPFAMVLASACAVAGAFRYLPGKQFWSTVTLSLMVLLAGFVRHAAHTRQIFHGPSLEKPTRMEGCLRIAEVLKRRESSTTLRCERIVLQTVDSGYTKAIQDAYMLVQLRDPPSLPLFPGDTLLGSGWVSAIQAPLNPHAFDLRDHYRSIGVRHRMNAKGDEIRIIPSHQFSLWRMTAKWQYSLSSMVHAHTSTEVGQLTNALVWGDRSDMEQDVIDAFADSGAMHVLSVSGMHVAIIYSMLYLLLGPPGAGTFTVRMIRLAAYAAAIMLYMALTGGSAAVVRAGSMIILYLLGKSMGWNTQVWNLLGFAAFVMLWINPFVWHNIGFQLSFLAMAGLLLFTKPISRILSLRYTLLQRTWEICAVSIAAQVFILPVLLAKFHQFPLTFIASSLVAMPAGYVIIFGALLNVMLSSIGLHGLWPLLDKAGMWFIDCMKWMAGLNPEMHFAFTETAVWLLMAVAIFFSLGLIYEWAGGKKIAFVAGIGLITVMTAHRLKQWTDDDIVVYHTYGGLLIDVIREGHCLTVRDSLLASTAVEFAARGNRSFRDIISRKDVYPFQNRDSLTQVQGGGILQVGKETWLILGDRTETKWFSQEISVIIPHPVENIWKMRETICHLNPGIVVLPAHLPNRTRYALTRFFDQQGLACHDISRSGYFRRRL